MNILCCGLYPALQRTLHLPALRTGRVNRVRSAAETVGGKAVNAARVLNTLGANPLLTGFCGGDTGKTVRRLLDEEGLAHAFIQTDEPVRICQTLLADDQFDFTELVEEGPVLHSNDWKKLPAHVQTLETARVILSGTLPAHAPQDLYAKLIAAATGPVLLDTSGPALTAALAARPALVKINSAELRKTTGIEAIENAAQELLAQGAQAVGITQGPDTALLAEPRTIHRFILPRVEAVSTLGCGDSVNAGIAFALESGRSLPAAFCFGLACGAANAMNRLPGIVNPDQISTLVQQIQIQ